MANVSFHGRGWAWGGLENEKVCSVDEWVVRFNGRETRAIAVFKSQFHHTGPPHTRPGEATIKGTFLAILNMPQYDANRSTRVMYLSCA